MTKSQLKSMFIGKDDAFWGIVYDKEEGGSCFPTGHHASECTGYALAIQKKLGAGRVRVMGFFSSENPRATVSGYADGHDFAVVENRFIVDPWVVNVENIDDSGVYDLV